VLFPSKYSNCNIIIISNNLKFHFGTMTRLFIKREGGEGWWVDEGRG
jgi:hypothetical protein